MKTRCDYMNTRQERCPENATVEGLQTPDSGGPPVPVLALCTDHKLRGMTAIPSGPRCVRCMRLPQEIPEYVTLADVEGYQDAAAAVEFEEGTYNPATEGFYCTECYIAVGQPMGVAP